MKNDPYAGEVPDWFGRIPAGCDVPDWLPFMTADEAGFDRPKLTIDFQTGKQFLSFPTGWPCTTAATSEDA